MKPIQSMRVGWSVMALATLVGLAAAGCEKADEPLERRDPPSSHSNASLEAGQPASVDPCPASDAVVENGCPFPACSCPRECMAVDAIMLDEAAQCRRKVVLGCVPGPLTTDGPCFKRLADGLLVNASGSAGLTAHGWVLCTEEEARRIEGPICAN
ncbi:MAG: hypothetical protein KF764_25350 [Labilithrix sp.]|nr:hypothetical protein [Labilithrix sp.]MBX3222997.1 hypothetical protein [Labilithrix sp.]